MYVCIYVCTCTCTCVYMHMYMYRYMYKYMYKYMYVTFNSVIGVEGSHFAQLRSSYGQLWKHIERFLNGPQVRLIGKADARAALR